MTPPIVVEILAKAIPIMEAPPAIKPVQKLIYLVKKGIEQEWQSSCPICELYTAARVDHSRLHNVKMEELP